MDIFSGEYKRLYELNEQESQMTSEEWEAAKGESAQLAEQLGVPNCSKCGTMTCTCGE